MPQLNVLILDKEVDARTTLAFDLNKQGHAVLQAAAVDEALAVIQLKGMPDLLLVAYNLRGLVTPELVLRLTTIDRHLPRFVLLTSAGLPDKNIRQAAIPEILHTPYKLGQDILAQIEPVHLATRIL